MGTPKTSNLTTDLAERSNRRRWRRSAFALFALGTAGITAGLLGAGVASAATTTVSPAHVASAEAASSPCPRPTAVGKVTSVGTTSFTIATPDGSTLTVDVSDLTVYHDPTVSNATYSDVTVGESVAVVGTRSGAAVTASQVLIGTPPSPARTPSAAPKGAKPIGQPRAGSGTQAPPSTSGTPPENPGQASA